MPFLGEIAALTTACLWSVTAIVFTQASKRIGGLQVNLFRIPVAVVLLATTYFLFWGDLNVSRQAALMLAISGVIGLAIGDTFLFKAMAIIGSRLSMLLMATTPAMTALLAYFFLGEPLTLIMIVGILVTLAGVSWVVVERVPTEQEAAHRLTLKGLLFGILGALGQAVGLIFAKKGLIPEMHPLLATLIRMTSAALILWPLMLLARKVKNPLRLFGSDLTSLRYLLIGVVCGPFLGVTMSLTAIKLTDTGVAATLMSTVPVTMLPLVVLIEKERLTTRAIAGAFVAVAGVVILMLR